MKTGMNYAQIEKRVNLSIEHFKKPCLHGDCEQDGDSVFHCDRHADTAAIVRRYIRMKKFRKSMDDFEHEPDRPRICADEKWRSRS